MICAFASVLLTFDLPALADISFKKVYNDSAMKLADVRTSIYKRALEITWLAVIFLVPLFFNPESHKIIVVAKAALLQFLVLAMLGFWIADWMLNRAGHRELKWRSIFSYPLHLAILVFGLIVVAATAASITPAISFWGSYFRNAGLLILICWILFFLILAQQIRNRAQLLRAVYTLLLSSGIVALIGILQYFFPEVSLKLFRSPTLFIHNRVFSTIGNPLFLSSFLAMVIPLNLAFILHSWNKRKEGNNTKILIGLVILLALQLWCLWMAQYSITILLYIIAPIIFIILLSIVKRKRLILSLSVISLLALGIIAVSLLLPLLSSTPSTETNVTEKLEPVPIYEEMELKTLDLRVQYWKIAIDIILKSPEVPFSNDKLRFLRKVIGYGPETFYVTSQLFFPQKQKIEYTSTSLILDRPHNDYLYMATTMGLLGLTSFLSILAVFFYLCFRYLRRTTADIDKLLLVAMVAGMVQYMADIFFNLSTIAPELVFWLMLAMTCVIGRFIRNEEPARAETEEAIQAESGTASYITRTRLIVSLVCAVALIIIGLSISIRPFLADIYYQKGIELQRQQNEYAIYAFDKAAQIYPEEPIYWYSLGAYSYYVARNVKEEAQQAEILTLAANAGEKARELDPYFAYRYYVLADFYAYWANKGATDKWPAALSLYDKASQLFPDNAVLLNKWSLALIIKGDFDEARTKLDYTASIEPHWPETSLIYGFLLAREGENDAAVSTLTAPIQDKPANLNYFIDLCLRLNYMYDMVSPLRDALEIHIQKTPDDWISHAMLGTTSLLCDDLDKGIDEFNTAMMLVPSNDAGDLFQAILRLSDMNPSFRATLATTVAAEWRDKLDQSPERDTLLPELDKLLDQSTLHFL